MTNSNIIRDERLSKLARVYHRATNSIALKEGIDHLRAFANENNYKLDAWNYVEVTNVTDVPFEEREVLMQILEDAERGEMKALLILSADRLGRNAENVRAYIEALNKNGCEVVVCD